MWSPVCTNEELQVGDRVEGGGAGEDNLQYKTRGVCRMAEVCGVSLDGCWMKYMRGANGWMNFLDEVRR